MAPNRRRKFVSSSSSDEYDPTTGVCSIEDYMAGKDLFRVAPVKLIPTTFPFKIACCTKKGADAARAVQSQYLETLRKYEINYSSISFRSCWRKGFHSEAADTLYVSTRDTDTRNWEDAATDILILFLNAGLTHGEVKVEICNPERMYRDMSFCLPDNSQLLGAIREIEPHVQGVVFREMPGIWTSIAYHMRGSAEDVLGRKPTVFITCKPHSRLAFQAVESKIEAVIQSTQFPQVALYVEIVPGLVELCVPPSPKNEAQPIRYTDLQYNPANGASIGVYHNQLGAGTLGGWVVIKPTNDASAGTIPCAMTCYHVISDGDLGNQSLNDSKGIALEGKPPLSQIKIVYPANFDANVTRKQVQTNIENNEDIGGFNERTLGVLDGLKADGHIGFVKHASGHRRTQENSRLDWALILTPRTFGKNRPPTASGFGPKDTWFGRIQYRPGPNDFITSFGVMKEGDWVVKTGRTTGSTTGEVNKIRRLVEWQDYKQSFETEVFGIKDDFADKGDSGAWVVNVKGELVGMVIGVDQMSTQIGCGIVTPIDVIRADIRKMTGCEMSLPI